MSAQVDHPETAASPYRRGPHWAALAGTAMTLPLLFLGGSVTSYGVGMAVPDWPTTFGANMFLYQFWNDSMGVKLEHSHRLYGAAVGLATIVVTSSFLVFERRRSLKILGVVALAAVSLQGVMGGLRVSKISTTWAVLHGCFGQAFFGLMVVLCVLTSRGWRELGPARPDSRGLREWSAATLILIYAQIVAGAVFRHFHDPAALGAHGALALAVLAVAVVLTRKVASERDRLPGLSTAARALGWLLGMQIVLGLAVLALMLPLGGNPRPPTLWQAMLRTSHQTNGALVLAASVVLCLKTFGMLRSPRAATDDPIEPSESPRRTLEALA